MVIVPVLPLVPVLAVAVKVSVPLLLPDVGLTVNHPVALLLAVQDTFEFTLTVVLPLEATALQVLEETVKVGGTLVLQVA